MTIFGRYMFVKNGEAGVTMSALGDALAIWTAMQNREKVTIAEAMAAFNTEAEIIYEAIEGAPWAFMVGSENDPTKQTIVLDGE